MSFANILFAKWLPPSLMIVLSVPNLLKMFLCKKPSIQSPPPPPPLLFLLSFMLPKPGIHSFKSKGNPLQNERDHAHPDLENLSFFFFLSPLFFSFFFFSSPSRFLFFFFFFFLSLNSLHFVHLQSQELPQSISDFPSSIAGQFTSFLNH